MLTTADYALIVSIASAFLSLLALAWNVASKYIFVKPSIQVATAVYSLHHPDGRGRTVKGKRLINITVTNMGPGAVIIHNCIAKGKSGGDSKSTLGILNPIDGNVAAEVPKGIGPFGGGLPAKLDAGEVKSFYFPYEKGTFLENTIYRIGVVDTYGRRHWCRRSDVKKLLAAYRRDFPN